MGVVGTAHIVPCRDRPHFMVHGIRVIALGIVRRPSDGALLVEEGRDPSDGRVFQRPLGGAVEFGEHSARTVEREFMEETGLTLRTTGLVGVVESLFRYSGEDGHEIVFLHAAEFEDPSVNDLEHLPRIDAVDATILWRPLNASNPMLVPEGIGSHLTT
jgi:8-oxo-dGTP pyrophosphatase MutT (NUDIX family)